MTMPLDQGFPKAHSLSPAQAMALFQPKAPSPPLPPEPLVPATVNPPVEELEAVVAPYRQGRASEALDLATALLARFPTSEILHNIMGAIHAALGRPDRAVAHHSAATQLAPDYFEAFNNLGNALVSCRRLDEAVASFDAAIALNPDYAEAHMNRGIVLRRLARLPDSLASLDRAIGLDPACAEAYSNRGNTLLALNRGADALADYDRAIALKPGFADALFNRGNALLATRRPGPAVASYDEALALAPSHLLAHRARGTALRALERIDEALDSFERAQALAPGSALMASEVRNLRATMCLWTDPQGGARFPLGRGEDAVPPFYMLTFEDDPAYQLECARIWAEKDHGPQHPAAFPPRAAGDRIRIGYFSADFHSHATMVLLGRVLELHDRDRFEIHLFSYGPPAGDAMRRRALGTVDAFHEVGSLDDAAVAQLARTRGIDLAVDLKGYTWDNRAGIFAHRAAPVQVNYLGYPGSMGAAFIDHIIADRVIIPPGAEAFYSEKVAFLPNCYQPNDDRRAISARRFGRAELGLPEQGFVFCCFNNNYKITPAEFDIWMRLLGRIEGSVLWLLADNRWAVDNLRREAVARGIAPDRLVFAPRLPLPEHLARHRQADLFLDTFAVNAHTTASDALWAGLPLVTTLGSSFAARVAGSLLHALDMPELVTDSAADYERLAFDLATDPDRLAAVRAKLDRNRLTAPLFDAQRYTRDLEALYEKLLRRD